MLTINTHKGLFRIERLNFGVSSAPAIFQSVMDRVLSGVKNVVCFFYISIYQKLQNYKNTTTTTTNRDYLHKETTRLT